MEEQRKHAILFAATFSRAWKLIESEKANLGTQRRAILWQKRASRGTSLRIHFVPTSGLYQLIVY
jgi:hypothetical protein